MPNFKNNVIYYPRSEKIIIFAICSTVAFNMVDGLVNRLFQVEFWDSLLTKGIYFGSLLIATFYALKRFKKEMFLFPLFVMVLWLLSYLVFPNNREVLTKEIIYSLTTQLLPIFIITLSVKDYKRLLESLRITSMIVTICALIYLILGLKDQLQIGYMEFAYQLMFSALFLFIYAVKYKNKIDIIMSLSGIMMIFVLGSRGAMVGVIAGIVFYFLNKKRASVKRTALYFSITGIFYLVFSKFLVVIGNINIILQSININSRTINLLLENEIINSSGRGSLYDQSISALENNLFIGTGMAGDRAVLGIYTHNLFTELLLSYGVILGSVFIFALIYHLISSLFHKNKNEIYYIFFVAFFSSGFMKLMFSWSYLMEPIFFVMIALSFLIRKKNRKLNYLKH